MRGDLGQAHARRPCQIRKLLAPGSHPIPHQYSSRFTKTPHQAPFRHPRAAIAELPLADGEPPFGQFVER
jgi:hypothetical protein